MKKGTTGAAVIELQKALLALGFKLPRFGADGSLGSETLEAVDRWAATTGLIDGGATPNDAIPATTVATILKLASAAKPLPADPVGEKARQVAKYPLILDVREFANPERYGRNPWARIDTVCLHQMAVVGPGTWQRWKDLAIHFAIIHKTGIAAWLNDMDWRLPHGHGWNNRSVGIEVEGHFAGLVDNPKTHWVPAGAPPHRQKPMEPSEGQVLACHHAIRFIVEQVAAHGGQIKYIGAHRQSYGMKASDPGELIWKRIALPMMAEMGLTTAPTLPHHKYPGKPIPEGWDANQKGSTY